MARVAILRTGNIVEAQLAESLLRGEGVDVELVASPRDDVGGLLASARTTELLVEEDDAQRARSLLDTAMGGALQIPAIGDNDVSSAGPATSSTSVFTVSPAPPRTAPWWLVHVLVLGMAIEFAMLLSRPGAEQNPSAQPGVPQVWSVEMKDGCSHATWVSTGKRASIFCDRTGNGAAELVTTFTVDGRLLAEQFDPDDDGIIDTYIVYDRERRKVSESHDPDRDGVMEVVSTFRDDGKLHGTWNFAPGRERSVAGTESRRDGLMVTWFDEDADGTAERRAVRDASGQVLFVEEDRGVGGFVRIVTPVR